MLKLPYPKVEKIGFQRRPCLQFIIINTIYGCPLHARCAVSISAQRGGGSKYGNISRFVSPDDHLDYAAGINIRYR
jgi:hypothetical protein